MIGRIEHKYLIPVRLLDRIRADLQPYVDVDEFARAQASDDYTVRSIYYDNPRFDCYDEKQEGLEDRKKFRIRGYNRRTPDSVVFLEIKHKHGSFIAKSRAPLYFRGVDAMLERPDIGEILSFEGGGERERTDAKCFFHHYYRRGLRPAVLVVYDREAFSGKFDSSLRLTFDKNLRTVLFPSLDGLFDEQELRHVMPKHVIFEVKFFRHTLPTWVTSIVRRYELPRMALSKFTICLDSSSVPWKARLMQSRVFSPVWGSRGNGSRRPPRSAGPPVNGRGVDSRSKPAR